MSPSSQTGVSKSGATAELIGAPRDAGERGALDQAGLGDEVGGGQAAAFDPGVPSLHLVHLLDLPSHLLVSSPGAVAWFHPSNHPIHQSRVHILSQRPSRLLPAPVKLEVMSGHRRGSPQRPQTPLGSGGGLLLGTGWPESSFGTSGRFITRVKSYLEAERLCKSM